MIAFSLVALSLVAGRAAFSQSTNQVTVPFAFTAGVADLPAGDYLMRQKADSRFVTISDLKTGKSVFVMAPASSSLPQDAPARVVFRQVGSQHFLASIWEGGNGTARTFSTPGMQSQASVHTVSVSKEETVASK